MIKGRGKINVLSAMLLGVVVVLCGNTALANAPDWALKPPADTSNYYYGVGSSTNKSQAPKAALAEIASRGFKSRLRYYTKRGFHHNGGSLFLL